MQTHWAGHSQIWSKMSPPLTPAREVISVITNLIPSNQHIVLLGVTPQIANAYSNVTAIDSSVSMIKNIWPGDTDTQHAINDNWLNIDLPVEYTNYIVGDCSLNQLEYPTDVSCVLNRIINWLRPNGRFVSRMFTRYNKPITVDRLIAESKQPTVSWDAFRRLLPMYIAEQEGSCMRSIRMLEVFNELFPNRTSLPWPPELTSSLDIYQGSDTVFWIPTREEILATIPNTASDVRFIDVGSYDLADACPILTFVKK